MYIFIFTCLGLGRGAPEGELSGAGIVSDVRLCGGLEGDFWGTNGDLSSPDSLLELPLDDWIEKNSQINKQHILKVSKYRSPKMHWSFTWVQWALLWRWTEGVYFSLSIFLEFQRVRKLSEIRLKCFLHREVKKNQSKITKTHFLQIFGHAAFSSKKFDDTVQKL